MTRAQTDAVIVATRKQLAKSFASRCGPELLTRPVEVIRLCSNRPRTMAWVTVLNATWSVMYKPAPLIDWEAAIALRDGV